MPSLNVSGGRVEGRGGEEERGVRGRGEGEGDGERHQPREVQPEMLQPTTLHHGPIKVEIRPYSWKRKPLATCHSHNASQCDFFCSISCWYGLFR